MLRFAVFCGLGLAASACVPKAGRLEINRYQSEEYPYAVFYVPDGDPVKPLGGDWRVDNFAYEAGNRYTPKQGPDYVVERRYDISGDGVPDVAKLEPFYDLLLEHGQKDASMWIRTVPVPAKDKDKELAALAERYVESVSGNGMVAVRFGAEEPAGSVGKSFASRVLHTQSCTVSKRDAYRIDFEVASVGQAQLSDQARWQRGAVAFVRTGYGHRVTNGSGHADYPAMMAIGISARPEDFAALEPDFERLLTQTVLGEVGKGLSMKGETTCQLSAATPSSGGETAPATEAEELNDAAQVPLAPEAMPAQ
jgi:hypothetical protein